MKGLDQAHMQLVSSVMDMQLQRQNVIMGNIANVNTPKYKPLELNFEAELQKALNLDVKGKLSSTSSAHIPTAFNVNTFSADWRRDVNPRQVHGEDRVNIDKEMTRMAKNTLQYNTLAQITTSGYQGLKNIIAEGGKA